MAERFRAPDRGGYNAGYLKCLYLLVFKRDHVARSGQNKSDSLNCAAELASLKQSSHCLKAPFFNRRICCLPLTSSNSLMLGIVQVNLALPSLNRDFLAIATLVAPSQPPPKGEGIRRDIISPIGTTDHRRDLIPHCFQRYRRDSA